MKTLSKTKIKKWGNSQGLRLDKILLSRLNLNINDEVSVMSDDKSIVIKPTEDRNKKILDELLSKIPEDYKPKEIDWGGPVGREIW